MRPSNSLPPELRAELDRISLYTPDRRVYAIDLSDNTNQWGTPPAAFRAMQNAGKSALTRYPSGYGEELKESLASYLGVRADQIATGCGSDDVLDAAIRAFGRPGSRVAVIDPTFPMIPVFARINGLEPVLVPLTAEYDVDVERMLAVDASIIYLCSPNNPTGRSLDARAVKTIVEHANGIVSNVAVASIVVIAFDKTASEFPENGSVVKTSTTAYGYVWVTDREPPRSGLAMGPAVCAGVESDSP